MRIGLFLIFYIISIQPLTAQSYKIPVAYVNNTQPSQPAFEIQKCNDNNVNTIYHSNYSLTAAIPDQLNFRFFNTVKSINKLIYIPRTTGSNGIWTSIRIYYSTQADPEVFMPATGILSLIQDNSAKTINLPNTIVKPAAIRIDVLSGHGNFSSCAEMEFYSDEQPAPVSSECLLPTSEFSAYADIPVFPQIVGSSASNYQSGENIERSFDGDINTLYHSNYSSGIGSFPISLNYHFSGNTTIDYLRYTPRQNGSNNGLFGNVKISYNTLSDSNYVDLITQNFGQTNTIKTVVFPASITPLNIKIEVLDGKNNFASCAEMEFFRTNPNNVDLAMYSSIFSNDLFNGLKSSVTQQDIDNISSPFFKGLAQCLFNSTYNNKYRSQIYKSYKTLESIREEYKIGNYSSFENPTGIVFQENTTAILFAKDIKEAYPVYLKVRDFAVEGSSVEKSYVLRNGINIIPVTNRGLGYISYYSDHPDATPIAINVTAGIANGIFTRDTTSIEWQSMLTNQVYSKIDLEGYYTKMVLDKSAVGYYHFTDPLPLVNKYDAIAKSERELMGFFKFNKNFNNRQFVYTESSGGWNAGNIGVHLDLSWGAGSSTSANNLDIWGVSHELGHINQVRPGLLWVGTGEITNNIYSLWSYYNLNNPSGSNRFTNIEGEKADKTVFPKVTGNRFGEFIIQTHINGKSFMDLFRTDYVNPVDRHIRTLVPFWQLELYYQLAGAARNAPILGFDVDMADEGSSTTTPLSGIDYAHWYATVVNKVINTDESLLTQGELVMNFVKNTCDAVEEDLVDFFTSTGFLTPIDATIADYQTTQLKITQSMIDELKNYVLLKGYAKPVSPVINYISAHSLNSYKYQLPVSGSTGVGATITTTNEGQFLLVNNAQWQNAVAFETYNSLNKLISVSIVGTGDTSLVNTYVDFPADASKVYAVGYNGQKILVYPSATLAGKMAMRPKNNILISPNPVKNDTELKIITTDTGRSYSFELYDLSGKLLDRSQGSLVEITQHLNKKIEILKSGVYIIVLNDGIDNYQSKFIKE